MKKPKDLAQIEHKALELMHAMISTSAPISDREKALGRALFKFLANRAR